MPQSIATNAYELLAEVKALILEEPKRYCQETYLVRLGMRSDLILPACGTVACVAGWVATLKGDTTSERRVSESATEILGLDQLDSVELFHGSAIKLLADRHGIEALEFQTNEYAELGAEHIQRFMDAREEQLKAKAV